MLNGSEIAEFQGLYGTYHISELLLQKLWLRQDFDTRELTTFDGRGIRVLHPGKWNRLAGPDFLRARLVIDGKPVVGDVEVHFRVDAWRQHGHQQDATYDDVVLHVVLFPPASAHSAALTSRGREVPVLALVDRLWHDLEEYAADDAVAALNQLDPLPVVEELLAMDPDSRVALIRDAASRRWREKVHFANVRIQRLGWDDACHYTALEILGYRGNRTAMLHVATAFPLRHWREIPPSIDELVAVASAAWRLRGSRPANHPRLRLEQYRRWVGCVGDWPERLRSLELPALFSDTMRIDAVAIRKQIGSVAWRERVALQLAGGAVTATRWDTIMCNLVFPLRAAIDVSAGRCRGWEFLWGAWYPGDAPDGLRRAARHLDVGRKEVVSNGLIQGLLGLQMVRKDLETRPSDETAPRPVES